MPLGNFPRRMTVVGLGRNRSAVFSAIALDEAAMREVEAVGKPTFLIVPNGHHRLDAAAWKKRLSEAQGPLPAGREGQGRRGGSGQFDRGYPRRQGGRLHHRRGHRPGRSGARRPAKGRDNPHRQRRDRQRPPPARPRRESDGAVVRLRRQAPAGAARRRARDGQGQDRARPPAAAMVEDSGARSIYPFSRRRHRGPGGVPRASLLRISRSDQWTLP